MIERLINLERPYGEPEYSRLSAQISQLKQQLYGQLNQEGKNWLEQLVDTFMRQEHLILCNAFTDGFWTAVELMLEFRQRELESR